MVDSLQVAGRQRHPHCLVCHIHTGDFECYNNGKCVNGQCNCTPGYGGLYCEKGKDSAILIEGHHFFGLISGGLWNWSSAFGLSVCLPSCPLPLPTHLPLTALVPCGDGYCHNGGQCSARGSCTCSDFFVGQFCEQEICELFSTPSQLLFTQSYC